MGVKQIAYLSGPISDNPNYIDDFARYEKALTEMGYGVLNPAKLDNPTKPPPWHECIIRDLGYVLLCDFVALMPGWHTSHGARIEVMFALKMGKNFMPLDNAVHEVYFRLGLALREDDLPWGEEDDLESTEEKGWEDLGGMDDIPGWE